MGMPLSRRSNFWGSAKCLSNLAFSCSKSKITKIYFYCLFFAYDASMVILLLVGKMENEKPNSNSGRRQSVKRVAHYISSKIRLYSVKNMKTPQICRLSASMKLVEMKARFVRKLSKISKKFNRRQQKIIIKFCWTLNANKSRRKYTNIIQLDIQNVYFMHKRKTINFQIEFILFLRTLLEHFSYVTNIFYAFCLYFVLQLTRQLNRQLVVFSQNMSHWFFNEA